MCVGPPERSGLEQASKSQFFKDWFRHFTFFQQQFEQLRLIFEDPRRGGLRARLSGQDSFQTVDLCTCESGSLCLRAFHSEERFASAE